MTESERPDGLPGPVRPRRPEDFDGLYTGTPPWDIGEPQPVFVELLDRGAFRGRVLDVGCGTGEHVLLAASQGLDATGVDTASRAIDRAREKARERGVVARFEVHDALDLASLGEKFDTVLDCGLFHVLEDDDQHRFAESLGTVVDPGGRYYMVCFSDRQPGDWGPRRISRDEIRETFAHGWHVDSIESAEMEVLGDMPSVQVWLAQLTRS